MSHFYQHVHQISLALNLDSIFSYINWATSFVQVHFFYNWYLLSSNAYSIHESKPNINPNILLFLNKRIITCIDGFCKWPRLAVVCLGSLPNNIIWGLINLNASITTFPFTDWIGSITTDTAFGFNCSKLYKLWYYLFIN